MIGGISAIGILWGYNIHACESVREGASLTLVLLGFLIFWLPWISVTLVGLTVATTLAVREISKRAWIGERVALLAFLLPVLFIGVGYGGAFLDRPSCKVTRWGP